VKCGKEGEGRCVRYGKEGEGWRVRCDWMACG
jgi:hypothetical protein